MKAKAKIEVFDQNPQMLVKALAVELKNPKTDRSNYTITQLKGKVVFNITAQDSNALRATADSIIKLLIVYEKMSDIKSD